MSFYLSIKGYKFIGSLQRIPLGHCIFMPWCTNRFRLLKLCVLFHQENWTTALLELHYVIIFLVNLIWLFELLTPFHSPYACIETQCFKIVCVCASSKVFCCALHDSCHKPTTPTAAFWHLGELREENVLFYSLSPIQACFGKLDR